MKAQINWTIFVFPALSIFLLFVIEYLEHYLGLSFVKYGVLPRTAQGIKGIICSPFIHSDWKHLTNNAIPLFVLLSALTFFYRSIANEVLLWSWLMSGLWLWAIGRESYHIGASGILYAIASFLFFSGVIRRHSRLMAISLVVVFLYGGMIWGIFPMKSHISWEGHLSGGFAGLILAYWFRKYGPPKQVYQYEIDEQLEKEVLEFTYDYKEENKSPKN